MFRFVTLFALIGGPALAETYANDGFGIVPTAALSDERAAWAGLQDGDGTAVVPSGAPASVLLFIGPKALVAGKDEGHAVALAFDPHGNLVQDEKVKFSLETNGTLASNVADGIADVVFTPPPYSGTFAGGASVGKMQSARALYRVTADLEGVVPDFEGALSIRAEMFASLSSSALADQYGNAVEDGVGTSVLLAHETGETSFLFAPVREARAEALVLGRGLETGGSVKLHLATAIASGVFNYQAAEAMTPPSLEVWDVAAISALGLRLGPVSTAAGHLLTDGAPVEITLTGEEGSVVRALGWLQDGYFETLVQRPSFGNTVTVSFTTSLGSETRDVLINRMAPRGILGAE